MKQLYRRALKDTLPVLTGYLVLGFGFGIIMKANGFGILLTAAMSLLIYAGSMQYAVIGLMTGGASLLTVGLTTLMVNARHLFYGISMLEKYRDVGKAKPYLIFGLTDETYSLVCTDPVGLTAEERKVYYLLVTLLDHLYWVGGSLLGAAAGTVLQFNSEGIDFALTALFLVVFLEQWLTAETHGPALIGVGVSVVSLLIFGAESFLIPAMVGIGILLMLYKEETA
ncbi:MAG: AzlC family ABC transporter permease [Oscillospiraceae bacterium]|nr:AzlC family ABC transporter permease [Oscillospiraceae bacterium]